MQTSNIITAAPKSFPWGDKQSQAKKEKKRKKKEKKAKQNKQRNSPVRANCREMFEKKERVQNFVRKRGKKKKKQRCFQVIKGRRINGTKEQKGVREVCAGNE